MAVAELIHSATNSLNVQTVLLFTAILALTAFWIRRPRNLPPGPLAWPIIGNLPGLGKDQMHYVLDAWAKRYGSVTRVWLGSRLSIVLNDINSAQEALVKQADCFTDRMSRNNPQGSIVMSNGEVWKERRRFVLSALRTLGMGKRSIEHRINEEARRLLETIDGQGEKVFDPEHSILNAVSNIICIISFGYRFEYTDPKFARLIKNVKTAAQSGNFANTTIMGMLLNRLRRTRQGEKTKTVWKFIQGIVKAGSELLAVAMAVAMPLLRTDNSSPSQQHSNSHSHSHSQYFGFSLEKEHEESFDPNDIRDIIDMFLDESRQREKASDDMDEDTAFCKTTLWRGIWELFTAGTETTTNTLLWLLLYTASFEHVQQKVQKEIDDVIGSDRQPTFEDRNNMPYTNAVIMEILRLQPVAPLAVPHKAHYQTELLGYTIPKDTIVFLNVWSIHRDPNQWKNASQFNPSRFLSEDGKLLGKQNALMPFSLGRRICVGETLARMEIFLFFVNLLQRFTFSLPDGKPRPSLEGVSGFTLVPRPYSIKATKR